MQVFDRSDKSYLDWMQANPESFVINTERRHNTKYFVLHQSLCPYIATTNGHKHGAYTEREYIKICSSELEEIEKWLAAEKPNFKAIDRKCRVCTSITDKVLHFKSKTKLGKLLQSNVRHVNFENIAIGGRYDRNALASMWGYRSNKAISRGVITPANSSLIILFVTKEKQASLPQYNDYISDGYLYWEGEKKGVANQRITNSQLSGDTIHLFFRDRHHTDFTYLGLVELESYIESAGAPMQAVFRIAGNVDEQAEPKIEGVITPEPQLTIPLSPTTRQALVSSRVGQGVYRLNLVKLWNSCSVTGIRLLELLIASHIKPWRVSDNRERLDPYNGLLLTPNLDSLFDRGLITFENDGTIIISKRLTNQACSTFNIAPNMRLRNVFKLNIPYLKYHREEVFLG